MSSRTPVDSDLRSRFAGATQYVVNPVRSLPARISSLVFGATLVTALVVTGISVHAIDSFLRNKIEDRFPALLHSVRERLELWYDQRHLEVGVFSTSDIVKQNAGKLRADAQARAEVSQYLSIVLESFPRYQAIFLLDSEGEPMLSVGRDLVPPAPVRESLARRRDPAQVAEVIRIGDEAFHFVSAPIVDARSGRRRSLHAALPLAAVGDVLRIEELGEAGRLSLVGPDEIAVVASAAEVSVTAFERTLPAPRKGSLVADYTDPDGERVIGCSESSPRLGWTLVLEERYDSAFEPVAASIRRVLSINLGIVVLFGLGAFRIARGIARPIEALSHAARRISEGDSDVDLPASDARDEVGVLTRTFQEMTSRLAAKSAELRTSHDELEAALGQVRDQNDELHRVNEILEQLSITDGLTKLHNHRFFQERLAREVQRAERSAEPLSLILVDIDYFKAWNDRLGHSGGDEILRKIADLMDSLTRETDLLARYGGEEFALLLPNTDLEGAAYLGEKLRSRIADARLLVDSDDRVTVSVGVARYSGNRLAFFEEADRALYDAKAGGRDCVVVAGE